MLPTLITGTIGAVPIYKNEPALTQSRVAQTWSRISTKICSNSSTSHKFFA